MRKSQAIKILETQKQIFIDSSYQDRSVWMQLTSSYILDFFGQDSSEYNAFTNFEFTVYFINKTSEQINYEINSQRKSMIGLIDNCIIKIKTGKLYRKPQSNILSSQTNERLIAIIFTISFAVFSIGYYFGVEKVNKDSIKTEIQYKSLKDSLSSVKPFVDTNSMTDKKK